MAGLFDRISKAVGDLTKKVEETGLLDEVKDLVSGEETSAETVSSTAQAAETATATKSESSDVPQGWAAAVTRAGVDPMALLTPEAIGSALDQPFDHSYPQLDDEWFGVTWTTRRNGGPYVDVRFTHGYTDGSPVDVPGMWQFVTVEAGAEQVVDVDGRVEARLDDLGTLYVRTPQHLFYVLSGGLDEAVDTADLHRKAAVAIVRSLLG